jgi:hypothetical protein
MSWKIDAYFYCKKCGSLLNADVDQTCGKFRLKFYISPCELCIKTKLGDQCIVKVELQMDKIK